MERLLTNEERSRYEIALKETIRWFAFEIDKLPAGAPATNVSTWRILENARDTLSQPFLLEIDFKEPSSELLNKIGEMYQQLLRGKTWAQLLLRYLSQTSRRSKYQYENLWEISVRLTDNSKLDRIVGELSGRLGIEKR